MLNPAAYDALPDPDRQAEFYADVPVKRLVAWLIDSVLILGLCLVLLPFTVFTALFFFPLYYLVLGFAYRVVTLATGSATLGMRLMALEMRTARGERLDLPVAALHTLFYSLSLSLMVPQVISGVLMLTTARAQGLGDMVLGTVAMNRARQF